MEFALTTNYPLRLSPLLPSSRFPLFSTSLSFPASLRILRIRKHLAVFCSISASSEPFPNSYGGWEDLQLPNDPNLAGKLDPVRSFLISIGINDQKHAVVFLLGFASAFLVSRIRFSLMVLFPVSALVFGAGFSAGLAQGGAMRRIGEIASAVRVSGEKVRDLGKVFSDLDGKVTDLGVGLKGFFASNGVEMGRIEDYLEAVDCVRSSIINAKKELESSLEMEMEKGRKLNQKPGKGKGDLREFHFDFMQFLGSLFQENDAAVKQPMKAREAVKGEAAERTKSMMEKNGIEEKGPKVHESREHLGRMKRNGPNSANTNRDSHNMEDMNRKRHFGYRDGKYDGNGMFSYGGEVGALNLRNSQFMYNQGSCRRTYFQQSYESHASESGVRSFIDPSTNRKEPENALDFYNIEPAPSSVSDDTLLQDRSYLCYNQSRNRGVEIAGADATGFQDENGELSDQCVEKGHSQSPSTFSDDSNFSKLVMEASDLIKQARSCLTSQDDQETADTILYRSASLLSTAVSIQPMSLLAVGQLGNTYLLHGELKLKISRELRTLLTRSDGLQGCRLWLKNLDTHGLHRENVASVLIDVCEECEELLIEAGRKYRLALSIDGNDVRALYNWGLALSFRAQLIADIGPEAAFDADKVYLAAIDKFDAMVSKTNSYAPDALFRWGVTLQHRSHLRAHNGKGKMKLLQQAKSLFEDVLSVESNNLQVREALAACISELNQRGRW